MVCEVGRVVLYLVVKINQVTVNGQQTVFIIHFFLM